MRVISQSAMRPHVLVFPAVSQASRFRALAERMLNSLGVAWGAPSIDRARAVVGWFAKNAVHPQAFLHPDGTTKNTAVLPSGETWASFNALFNAGATITRDQAFWYSFFPNGTVMLEKLVGTVAANGTVSDNGMLTEYEPGKWRIRNFTDYRAPQCTLQCKMAQVILAAMGIFSIDISTAGHDPMMFYDIEASTWRYIDPTFGEMLKIDGRYAGPLDLLTACLNGRDGAIVGEKLPGADYIPVGYYTSPTYPAGGMSFMTIHTAPQWAGGLSDRAPYRFGTLPSQSATNDRNGSIEQLLPTLGVGVQSVDNTDQAVEIRLRSNWPDHVAFQRSTDEGTTWTDCGSTDYLTNGTLGVRYRSRNAEPFSGSEAKLTL